MPTTTNFREIRIGDGKYAAVDQNRLNAQRGTFVANSGGGRVTPGTSTSEVTLNIEPTEFYADLQSYNLNAGQPAVTLSPNTAPYPRRDLVLARVPETDGGTASYDTIEGDPIDSETMQTLVDPPNGDSIVRDDGTPIAPVRAIPEVQPPEALDLLNEATLLAMVWVPPGTTDATDLTDAYISDLREPGSGPVDVLRPGGALAEIKNEPGTINATVSNSEQLGGQSLDPIQGLTTLSLGREDIAPEGRGGEHGFYAPGGFAILQCGVFQAATLGIDDNWAIEFRDQSDNLVARHAGVNSGTFANPHNVVENAGSRFTVQLTNRETSGNARPLTAAVTITTRQQ